ncbi:hypothetical protein Cgig2_028894 [Carnegiea gigantea]|uniref:2-carboxy-D-arabinitol-1-phosphatase n=1 Tax=Carnegiea gigantea TaxID=171969 RepID=A0A9Q1QME2_9CARY|nr:hypothetical protein Cgig2_028894 [Carnegiea gigantea]
MGGGLTLTTTITHLGFYSIGDFTRISKPQNPVYPKRFRVQSTSSIPDLSIITEMKVFIFLTEKIGDGLPLTGGAWDFRKATISLAPHPLASPKKVTLVRHGLSSWNLESRVQGSSDDSVLTDTGVKQAERCREALSNMHFDRCFSSPISRARSTAEILWRGREDPVIYLDSLKEAHLFFLEGMKNGQFLSQKNFMRGGISEGSQLHLEAEDAKERFPKEYNTWREDPVNFNVNGVYPIRRLWGSAADAWSQILSTTGESFLVVTHKSILRALVCTALGLGPERYALMAVCLRNISNFRYWKFRAIDVNNGGISVFNVNKKGEAMLQSLNMTAHMYGDLTYVF